MFWRFRFVPQVSTTYIVCTYTIYIYIPVDTPSQGYPPTWPFSLSSTKEDRWAPYTGISFIKNMMKRRSASSKKSAHLFCRVLLSSHVTARKLYSLPPARKISSTFSRIMLLFFQCFRRKKLTWICHSLVGYFNCSTCWNSSIWDFGVMGVWWIRISIIQNTISYKLYVLSFKS